MNRAFVIVLLIAVAAAAGLPGMAGKVDDPFASGFSHVNLKERFDHDAHHKVFKDEEILCTHCHLTAAPKKEEKGGVSPEEAAALRKYLRGSCHFCHVNPDRRGKAPEKCATCHSAVAPPPNHLINRWRENHELAVKFQPRTCEKCHASAMCINCHRSRETVRRDMHRTNFLWSHSIEARVRPQRCSHCHPGSYCVDCHSRRRDW